MYLGMKKAQKKRTEILVENLVQDQLFLFDKAPRKRQTGSSGNENYFKVTSIYEGQMTLSNEKLASLYFQPFYANKPLTGIDRTIIGVMVL